jgi:hypothetical protein
MLSPSFVFVHDVLDKNISFTITALKGHLEQIEGVKNYLDKERKGYNELTKALGFK